MLNDTPTITEQTPAVSPGNYSPVTIHVSDSVGAIFLGIFAVIMLIGWRRAETRLQRVMSQSGTFTKDRSSDVG